MDFFDSIVMFAGAFLTIILMLIILVYVIGSLACYKALKHFGYARPWMAWIPIACDIALVQANNFDTADDVLPNVSLPMNVFQFYPVLCFVLNFIPGIGSLLSMALRIICGGWVYKYLFASLKVTIEDEVKVLGYVAAFFAPVAWVIFFKEAK